MIPNVLQKVVTYIKFKSMIQNHFDQSVLMILPLLLYQWKKSRSSDTSLQFAMEKKSCIKKPPGGP